MGKEEARKGKGRTEGRGEDNALLATLQLLELHVADFPTTSS